MASSNVDLKTRIRTLQNDISSYKPGKFIPCHGQRIVFPNSIAIGVINLTGIKHDVVHAMRCGLSRHGFMPTRDDGKSQISFEDQKENLTDSISVIMIHGTCDSDVPDLARKAKCIVLLVHTKQTQRNQRWFELIKENTGRDPLCGVFTSVGSESNEEAKHELQKHGITDIYEVPGHNDNFSDGERLQWLDLLHGCLCEADKVMLFSNPSFQKSYEQEINKEREAGKRHLEEIRQREEEKKLLQRRIADLEHVLNESHTSNKSIVSENASLKYTMRVEQEMREQSNRATTENAERAKRVVAKYRQREIELNEKLKSKDLRIETMAENFQRTEKTASLKIERLETNNEDMTKKLKSNQQRVATLTGMLEGRERNETTLKQHVEELKKEREEDKARGEKEKRSLAAEMTKRLESMQHQVDALTDILGEKERNETTLRQHIEELKTGREEDRAEFEKEKLLAELSWKEFEYKEQIIGQLERETWKLRTKLQLESEIRSAEQKKKAETHKWSFISWVTPGKQAQREITSSGDNSRREFYQSDRSNASQAEEELTNDDFANILKQIADDLSEEAKIDSLGSQLGIIQGDIARALKTNMRYEQVTSRGTHLMLIQWREGVSREDERIELRRALVGAKLLDLADLYVPQVGGLTGLEHLQIIGEVPGSSGGQNKTNKPITTTHQALDDTSPKNQREEASEGMEQHSEESSINNIADDVQETSVDVSCIEPCDEGTSISDERGVEYTTINYGDLLSNIALTETSSEKLLMLLIMKVIIDIPLKEFGR